MCGRVVCIIEKLFEQKLGFHHAPFSEHIAYKDYGFRVSLSIF